ncbi:mitochondrial ubiquitin ligase activator of nfkb 1-A-like [Solea senegalensis]|uniref:RING-type E3 ubiquitin transferase n=2 Tax=Solea senegalensis TaxID=28829 RepID=A0AAV6TBY5_SOLSE|nr:mitochondrial ubiquitin ligase activator of nfkb 1-A-like [Solea senegalensis]
MLLSSDRKQNKRKINTMSDFTVNPLVVIGVGSSFAFSSLFYHLYQEKKKELTVLKATPLFKPDQHLLQVLKASPHKRLQYVAVEGQVQADGEPLSSRFVPRILGVVQKIAVEEHWKYWNTLTRTWNSRLMNKKESSNTVPFSLISPGAYMTDLYVRVMEPLEASGCFMERVYHKLKHAEEGLVNLALQGLAGEKPVAMEESEELLRVGSTLTGFGEVVLEGGQVMRLQPPQDGRKYILMQTDYRSFIDRHESSASMWKSLSVVTGLTGASLLAGVIYNLFGKQDDNSN